MISAFPLVAQGGLDSFHHETCCMGGPKPLLALTLPIPFSQPEADGLTHALGRFRSSTVAERDCLYRDCISGLLDRPDLRGGAACVRLVTLPFASLREEGRGLCFARARRRDP